MKPKLLLTLIISLISLNIVAQKDLSHDLRDRSFMIKHFQAASKEFNIPVEILEGIGFVESHWVQRIPDTVHREGNMPPAYGVMGLRDDPYFGHSLIKAANLINESPEKLKTDALSNIRGAAALLRSYANEEISHRSSSSTPFRRLGDWKKVIEKYSGIPQPHIANVYSYEVYQILNKGYDAYGIKIKKESIDSTLLKDPLKKEKEHEIYQ